MPIRQQIPESRRGAARARPGRRGPCRRATRWRPRLEALEQYVLLSAADLVVSSAIAPTILAQGESSRVGWSVANRGDAAAGASWSDAVYLSGDASLDGGDTPLGSLHPAPSSLAPGASYNGEASFTVPADAEPGSYYLLFVADSGGGQAEADESNNVRAVPVALTGTSSKLPDLVVTDATAPASAAIGNIAVSWTVENQGTGPAPSWYDGFYLSTDATYDPSDTFITTSSHFSGLAAGASQSFDATINLPAVPSGSYYLLFAADVYHFVTESDETNNFRAVPIALTLPDADLVVTAADAPASARVGDQVDLSWTVTNQGTDPAASNWYDYVYLSVDTAFDFSDSFVTSYYTGDVTPLAGGDSYSRTVTATLPSQPAGSYYLLFVADGTRNQAEADETNNVRAVPIAIEPIDVDLVVTDATAPASAQPGVVDLSWTVTNQGADPSSASWYDNVYLSSDPTFDFTDSFVTSRYHYGFTPLGPGESYTVSETTSLPGVAPGDYYLLFVADEYEYVAETDETNNIRAVPITIEAPVADLVVTAADAPATATAGGTADVSWAVTNQGTGPASASWSDDIYLSTDTTFDPFEDTYVDSMDTDDVSPLAAGDGYTRGTTIALPWVGAGSYYLLFVADGSETQAETDETNNVRAVPIAIEAPGTESPVDLVISDADAPETASPGQYVPVSWIVTNFGDDAAATSWVDGVYLSADDAFDPGVDAPLASISTASQVPLPDGRGYIVSMDVLIPAGTAPGDYHLFLVANSDEAQDESDCDNNVADLFLTVAEASAPAPTVSSFAVNDGEAQRSMVTRLTLTFSGEVTIDDGAFRLERSDGAVVGLSASSQVVGGQTVVTLTFAGDDVVAGSLADGRYTLTVRADRVRGADGQALDGDGDGAPGGDYVDEVLRLFGDADGDGDVDNKDYLSFRSTAGKHEGDTGFLWFLDVDGDGIVDLATDYEAFKGQIRKKLV